MSDSSFEQYLERAMRLCSRQEKCSSDLLRKLAQWGVEEEKAARILRVLTEKKFVDDGRYARAYTRQQHAFRKWGRIKIRMTLKQKAIPEPLIEEALQEIDEQTYRQTLKNELLKKRKTLKGRNRYDLLTRLQRYAYNKGYEPGITNDVLDGIL